MSKRHSPLRFVWIPLLLLVFSATLFYIWLSVAIGAGPQWVIALCWIGMGFLWASGVFACFPARWKRVRFVLFSGFVITLAALFAELGVRMPLANRESRIDGAIKANMHDSDRALERHDSPCGGKLVVVPWILIQSSDTTQGTQLVELRWMEADTRRSSVLLARTTITSRLSLQPQLQELTETLKQCFPEPQGLSDLLLRMELGYFAQNPEFLSNSPP